MKININKVYFKNIIYSHLYFDIIKIGPPQKNVADIAINPNNINGAIYIYVNKNTFQKNMRDLKELYKCGNLKYNNLKTYL